MGASNAAVSSTDEHSSNPAAGAGAGFHRRRLLYAAAFIFVGAAFLLRAWLLVPTFDDGVIADTILGSPYYSEYHELYVPFYKPLVTLLLPLRFVPHPASFALAALVHGLLIVASACVTYLIARRHAPAHVAAVAGAIALYGLFALDPFPPVRPEGLLLLTILAVVYMADTWRLTGHGRYLLAAGVLTGALALPLHTNASIAYIFLAFFALRHARSLGPGGWTCLIGGLAVSSAAGMFILLAPAPGDLPRFLAEYSDDGSRYTFIAGEVRRFTVLLRPAPLLPVVLFFGAVGLVVLLRERTRIAAGWSSFARRYSTPLMLGLATFAGLGLLPSAEWSHYLVYYVPAMAVFAALAYEHGRPRVLVGIGVGCLVVGAVCLLAAARFMVKGEIETWAFTGLVYGAVAAVLMTVSWASGHRTWLAAALVLGVVFRLGLVAADHEAHTAVVDALRARSPAGGRIVLGPPELSWAFAEDAFRPIDHNWDESPPAGAGVVATRSGSTKPGWRDRCTFSDTRPIPVSGFVFERFRGGQQGRQWEISDVACEDP